jgi:outer membrane protein TolC
MQNMKFFIMMTLLCHPLVIFPQQILQLEECYEEAEINYPVIKQYELIEKTEKFILDNINKEYLPQFVLNGQASYQSNVTKIPNLDEFSLNKDQYKVTLDAYQTIWDGGNTISKKNITKTNTLMEKNLLKIDIFEIREKVNQLYFGILSLDEQLILLNILKDDINANHKVIASMEQNGQAIQSDLDIINIELLNIKQKQTELQIQRDSHLKMLSLFLQKELGNNTFLTKPSIADVNYGIISRPEIDYYHARRLSLEMQKQSIKAKNLPQIGLFFHVGYGRPGLNFLENKFSLYGIGGVKLVWNFGNWYTSKNEIQIINNSISKVNALEETFRFNTNMKLTEEQSKISKLKKMIEEDNEIILIRSRIRKSTESQYKNGLCKINDLIQDINAEDSARRNKVLREIQYLFSIYTYLFSQGNN